MKKAFKFLMVWGWTLVASSVSAADVYLHSDIVLKTLPNGSNVVMWGFGTNGGPITVPGPQLVVPPGDTTLRIYLTNKLPVPVSIVIPGQYGVGNTAATVTPVRTNVGGVLRAKSYAQETPTDGTNWYQWTNLKPGTYLYHSGSHPAVQVHMGLYGVVKADYQNGLAYPGQSYTSDVALLFSEVDPVIIDAVNDSTYGTPTGVPSMIHYSPRFFMINGEAYTNGIPPINAGAANDRILLRFLNIGYETHVPIINNAFMRLIAEDGNLYPHNNSTVSHQQYSLYLAPSKTIDAILIPTITDTENLFTLYDRRLSLANYTNSSGGMLRQLAVSGFGINPQNVVIPDSWIQKYFGSSSAAPANAADQTAFALADPDKDGVNNVHEYIADTDPTSALSYLKVTDLSMSPERQGRLITFGETSTDRSYTLQCRTDFVSGQWIDLMVNVPGTAGQMNLVDHRPVSGTMFYRVKVVIPQSNQSNE
jgi:hypothetical protein